MIDFSELYDALEKLPERLEKAVMDYGKTSAQKLRTLAVKNRPWTDRTAHARQRLHGECERYGHGIRMILLMEWNTAFIWNSPTKSGMPLSTPFSSGEAGNVMQGPRIFLRGLSYELADDFPAPARAGL